MERHKKKKKSSSLEPKKAILESPQIQIEKKKRGISKADPIRVAQYKKISESSLEIEGIVCTISSKRPSGNDYISYFHCSGRRVLGTVKKYSCSFRCI